MEIHILLVEDEAPKRAHVEKYLKSVNHELFIEVAKSVNSALDALENEPPDLLILDMSLPTFDVGGRESGGRPQGIGGIEILRYMTMSEIICPTIVITGYEAFKRDTGKTVELSRIRAELANDFPQLIRGVLHYNSTYEEWKVELRRTLVELGILAEDDR